MSDKVPDQIGNVKEEKNKGPEWALLPFFKDDAVNPIMKPFADFFIEPVENKRIGWENADILNPAAIVKDDKVYLLYRARQKASSIIPVSRIGIAESIDGINFKHHTAPVLYPDSDEFYNYESGGGCEDPRVVEDENGKYYMTYTAADGYNARLFIATSDDLVIWQKHGSVFKNAFGGKYIDKWTKSGSIVSRYENGKIIAAKINGKYWMYFGDSQIWIATSDNLINWEPVLNAEGEMPPVNLRRNAVQMPELKIVLSPRDGMFDSDLVESGPPAMITKHGILLIYNSRNDPAFGDKTLNEGTYTPSQVLIDINDPTKVIDRMDTWFMKPDMPYELTGDVDAVCFVEGLVYFQNRWLLYYGTADTDIAIAESKASVE
ncbi:glycosidase [Pedobacter sp. HMF7647]|uniref:Glycosidase n=1 Tax=Hufsiella arboris TaxID=2695275 RepID=A0A7K1YA26_9SPHI|nr:glycoside hydrolase family 130 protein [Hufsiella arboris]MXV51435.1 glycosidase [Hufsiella arboris]